MRHPDGPPATYYVENPSGGQCVENPWLGQPVRGKPLPSGRGIELADPLNLRCGRGSDGAVAAGTAGR